MVKVSAVIITYNEEQNIQKCLDSLTGVADEIVVVDSFSEDRTEEICSHYPVTFVKHLFQGHIEQKNYAVKLAKYPYILSLDADELLTPELKDSILKVKQNWSHYAYSFNRLNNTADNGSGLEPGTLIENCVYGTGEKVPGEE